MTKVLAGLAEGSLVSCTSQMEDSEHSMERSDRSEVVPCVMRLTVDRMLPQSVEKMMADPYVNRPGKLSGPVLLILH